MTEGPFSQLSDYEWEVAIDLLCIVVATNQGFYDDEEARAAFMRVVNSRGVDVVREAWHSIIVERMAMGWQMPDGVIE